MTNVEIKDYILQDARSGEIAGKFESVSEALQYYSGGLLHFPQVYGRGQLILRERKGMKWVEVMSRSALFTQAMAFSQKQPIQTY